MKKKIVSILLMAAIAAGTLSGCGGQSGSQTGGTADTQSGSDAQGGNDAQAGETAAADEGKVINIYCWNNEFRERVELVYPEVVETSSDGTVTTLKDGTEIHWVVNPNQDGVYQQKLDEALINQANAAADDKVDIFLSETDYVNKYTDAAADVSIPLTDLGIDPDTDLADQYAFTKVTASDENGVQRGSTWQCCPGLLVYRRDIAQDVFGTDDPEAIGEKVKDWDTIKATAAELKAKGYYTFASYADTFRLYGNSIDAPWVAPGETTIKVDQKIMNWVSDSKEWLDAGYLDSTVKGQWNSDWNQAMGSASKVFAFLFPAWGIDFTLKPNWDGGDGAWAVTNPPQEYNWGGSYVHACTGTDNPQHVKDIILAVTADKDNLLKISKEKTDFTNTQSSMREAATDDANFSSEFLGGQNAFKYFAPVAENIKMAPLSAYDQGCVELIQNSFSDYFQGMVDFDKAKTNFETAIKERYPEITEIQWPE
ncbi:MAG: carbohydrate ABC transporter substrate-binding protein [Lachnospiraceae bacterium]|nr:carbohydrate ABC transporter substrate-binding protein [Lachnospiraceae bacterium]